MSTTPDPWAVLELDRATATERDVKRAYARLLKRHRPDQDPEGFQRANDAYLRALSELADAAAGTAAEASTGGVSAAGTGQAPGDSADSTPVVTQEPSRQAASPETTPDPAGHAEHGPRSLHDFLQLPEEFLTAFEALKERLQRGSQLPEVPEFNVLRNMVRENPALIPPWVSVLEGLFTTGPGLKLLPQLQTNDVHLLMLRGESACAARIMVAFRDDPALLNRLTQLANLMVARKDAADPSMLAAVHFTARLAAFHLPQISVRLADELYRETSPGVRERIVREIETRSAAGRIFTSLPHALRRFWEHQLFESGEEATDWNAPGNASALRALFLDCDQSWEGWPLVAQLVPREVLEETLRRERGKTGDSTTSSWNSPRVFKTLSGRTYATVPQAGPERRRVGFRGLAWFLTSHLGFSSAAALVILAGAFFLGSFGTHAYPPTSTPQSSSSPSSTWFDRPNQSAFPNPKTLEMLDRSIDLRGSEKGKSSGVPGTRSSLTTQSDESGRVPELSTPSLQYSAPYPSSPEQGGWLRQ
jgi:hypothetical protein